jgi:hypothetical protein
MIQDRALWQAMVNKVVEVRGSIITGELLDQLRTPLCGDE